MTEDEYRSRVACCTNCLKRIAVIYEITNPEIEWRIVCSTCLDSFHHRYKKLLEYVKSISYHFNFSESDAKFMQFYVKKEHEASELLQGLNND